jgi:hypothetical protein
MKGSGFGVLNSIMQWILNVSYYVVLASGITLVVVTIVVSLSNRTEEIPMLVRFQMDPSAYHVAVPTLGLATASTSRLEGDSMLLIGDSPIRWMIPVLLYVIVFCCLYCAVALQLRRILRAVRSGTPFTRANSSRLRTIGALIIIGEVVMTGLKYGLHKWASGALTASGVKLTAVFDLNSITLLLGVLILSLSEIFRYGADLEDERSLTV